MARAPRHLPLRITAGFFAFVFWLPSLAVGDLVIGLIPDSSASSHAAGNLAYGVIGAVLIAPAFATLTRRPERKIAPLQQIALVVVALACAAVGSGSGIGIAGAAVVLVSLLVVVARIRSGETSFSGHGERALRCSPPESWRSYRLSSTRGKPLRTEGRICRPRIPTPTYRLCGQPPTRWRLRPSCRLAHRVPVPGMAGVGDVCGRCRVPLRDRVDHQSAYRRQRWPNLGRSCDRLEPRLGPDNRSRKPRRGDGRTRVTRATGQSARPLPCTRRSPARAR